MIQFVIGPLPQPLGLADHKAGIGVSATETHRFMLAVGMQLTQDAVLKPMVVTPHTIFQRTTSILRFFWHPESSSYFL